MAVFSAHDDSRAGAGIAKVDDVIAACDYGGLDDDIDDVDAHGGYPENDLHTCIE